MNKTDITFDKEKKNRFSVASFAVFLLLAFTMPIFGQTTEFTYQGKLSDVGGQAAAYDFVFRLCASETDCSTPLAISVQSNVPVTSGGIFTVKLNFGAVNFNGADRFLEIAVKRVGETNYTTLAPRQKLTSAPYAIQALNTETFGNLGVSDFVQDNDPRIQPNNYVQNGTTAQTGANFNIGGTGTANIFNATTQFNLNGSRILRGPGTANIFVGNGAGSAFAAGGNNSFFGSNAGLGMLIGSNNTAVGFSATSNGSGLSNTTAVGAFASVTQSNSLVLGSINGTNGATADTRVGIGTTAPQFKLQILDSSNTGLRVQTNATGGTVASFGGNGVFQVDAVNVGGGRLSILENGNIGIGNPSPTAKLEVTGNGTSSTALEINNGAIKVTNAGVGSQTPVFVVQRNAANTCGNWTVLDNPYSNNDPNAILFVTGVVPERVVQTLPLAVYYETDFAACPHFNNKWVVNSPYGGNGIPRFNVMVIKR